MFFKRKPKLEWEPERISKIKKELKNFTDRKVKRRASRDAYNDLPENSSKNDPKYSNTERDLFSLAKRRFDELCQIYENSRQSLVKSIENKYRIDVLATEYESDFIQNVQGEIDTAFTEESAKLHTLAKDELRLNKDLRAFQARNELEDSAKPAKTGIWITVILLACLLGESAFNMTIFKDIGGYIAGFVIAVGCSAANIIMGFFCGFGGRLMIHISWAKKITGTLISLTMIGLASVWNPFIAHYREILANPKFTPSTSFDPNVPLNPDAQPSPDVPFDVFGADTGKEALESLLASPIIGIGDLTGYLLLLIGMVIFIFAAFETYNQFWDPYIGYSKAQGKADKATEAWREGQNSAVERIKSIVKEHKDKWDRKTQRSKQKIGNVQDAINALVSHRSEIVGSIEAMKRDANRALQVYRERNSFIRDIKPAYFENWVEFEQMKPNTKKETDAKKLTDIDFLPTLIAQDKLDKLKKNLAKNQATFASMTRQVNEIQTDYLKGIKKKFDAIYAEEIKNVLKGKKLESSKIKATEPTEQMANHESPEIV